ncbi:RecJ: single.stranded-DNA-specific exonuclease [Desulfosarcina variabilis str. Montpellier]|uniref:single-stranded-DNA-specific exonuclease RecJ n=1 Tax=Desulfosarcina variabilis TaxID=2300 RepID=UPI003AFB7704
MEKQWQILNPDPRIVKSLSGQLQCDPLLARLLAIRNITSISQAKRFLNPSFGHLTAPSAMADIKIAVQRISQAIDHGEKILVFGDYDADGVTATAVLVTFLRQCGARVSYAIPYRMTDGYGMGVDFINTQAKPAGTRLIITADCGSSSSAAVCQARQLGIDTIITDHHRADPFPPDALAVVNPTRPDCPAELSHLAGVGVAYYLIIALRTHLREKGFWKNRPQPNLKQLCDLVAIGTVADVVPLVKENRTLTTAGIDQINRGQRPGIKALIKMSSASPQPVDAEAIAFRLAPRINAAGRLVHARMACELLLTDNNKRAERLASVLCRLNNRRQSMESELLESILERIHQTVPPTGPSALVVDGDGWHEGILGIVAARLIRQFHCPAVVISTRNGIGKGSARSVAPIDLTLALDRCADLLDRFGGHPLAAGLVLPTANIDDFRVRLETAVKQLTAGTPPSPTLHIDAPLPLSQLSPALMESLERLGPFGQGNPAPLFMDTDVRVMHCKTVGGRHRQMVLQSGQGRHGSVNAIQFNVNHDLSAAPSHFEKIAFRPQWNYWNGRKTLQLVIEDTQSTA